MYIPVTLDTIIICTCITVTQILLHMTLLFHYHVPLIHRHVTLDVIHIPGCANPGSLNSQWVCKWGNMHVHLTC